jgi:hypothetical protein
VNRRLILIASAFVFVLFCSKAPETVTPTPAPAPATTSAQTAAPAPAAAPTTTPAATTPAAATPPATASTAPAAAPAGGSLQSQETNWPGVTAEVTEFRRKGNTLTGKVRLTNKGAVKVDVELLWKEVSLVDTAGGKKYEVLKDEKGTFISSLHPGWTDRWYESIEPSGSQLIWMKFPAPPPEVKTITLQLPKTPPFDDLQIQD